jgi:hypothetical protein
MYYSWDVTLPVLIQVFYSYSISIFHIDTYWASKLHNLRVVGLQLSLGTLSGRPIWDAYVSGCQLSWYFPNN